MDNRAGVRGRFWWRREQAAAGLRGQLAGKWGEALCNDQRGETGTATVPTVVWDQQLFRSYSEQTIGAGPEGGKYLRRRGDRGLFEKTCSIQEKGIDKRKCFW